jgi:CysZ protein
MNAVLRALTRALPLLADRRVLLLVAAPLAGAIVLWLVAAIAFGAPLTRLLAGGIAHGLSAIGLSADPGGFALAGGAILAFILITLAAGVLALAAISIFAGPVFVGVVATRYFPALEYKRGGTLAGGTMNALVAIALWIPLQLALLPLLLFPLIGVPASLALSAWVNQRLFRYDALAEHASAAEREALIRAARRRLFALGIVLSPLALVPFVNLVAPLYAGLAFSCLCLAELDALRRAEAPGGGVS